MMNAFLKPHPAWTGALLAMVPMQGLSGTALESGDFAGYSAVSDRELAALRGGFEVYIGGQLLSLAFSLERVSYLNGELLTLTRIEVPNIATAIQSPGTVTVSTYTAPPAPVQGIGALASQSPDIAAGSTYVAPPASGETVGAAASPPPAVAAGSTYVAPPASGETVGTAANPPPQIASVSAPNPNAGSQVTLIQNGAGNSVALPAQVDQQVNQALQGAQAQILQAYNHVLVIQNSLDNQVIQNMTTLNVTLSNEALARAIELNAGLAQMLNTPLVIRP